jgi:hypothetical protein
MATRWVSAVLTDAEDVDALTATKALVPEVTTQEDDETAD